jgi:hypothetical protein
MGNHIMEHCQTQINVTSPRVSKVIVVETPKQLVKIEVIQSFNVVITTKRVEMVVVAPNMDVVRRGVIIRFVANLGHGSGRFLAKMSFSRSLGLTTINTKVVGTP